MRLLTRAMPTTPQLREHIGDLGRSVWIVLNSLQSVQHPDDAQHADEDEPVMGEEEEEGPGEDEP